MSTPIGSAVAIKPAGIALPASPTAPTGINVLSFAMTRPLVGVPTLEAVLDVGDKPAPTGAQVLTFAQPSPLPELTFAFYVIESQVSVGRATIFAVGGAGGMRERMVGADGALDSGRDYANVSPRLIVEDLLADPQTSAGVRMAEVADAASLAALLALPVLPRWSRPAGTARAALTRLAAQLGMSWRVQPSGVVTIAPETWPAYTGGASGQPYYIDEPDASGLATVALEAPDLAPGMTIKPPDDAAKLGAGTLRVSDVIHVQEEGGAFRTRVRLVPADGAVRGRMADQFRRAVEGALPPQGLRVSWRATVVSQDADGLLGLRLESGAPVLSLSGVPIYAGWPGLKVQVPAGAQVEVAWFGGREDAPYVRSFAPDTAVTLVKFNDGTDGFSRVGDAVQGVALLYSGSGTLAVVPRGTPGSINADGTITSGSSKFKG